MIKNKIFTSMFVVCLLLISCAGNIPSVHKLDNYQETQRVNETSKESYLIGPGDILAINIWKEPDLSKETKVRLDGKISLPLVNDIKAAGLTCDELREQLIRSYKNYVGVPEVSVTVLESHSKKIYVLGKVNQPGEYILQKDMRIVQALSLAGGLDEWANRSDIRLIREINGTEKTFRVNYDAIVSGKDVSQNVKLLPDDTIYLP